ncbi:MAG: hypothetical protein KDE08_08770 [Rhodobacteraceae bacterium]|nr:hypothetical protein [Paracoccaceae bacterium]
MTLRRAHPFVSLALALLLLATTVAAGFARGQTQVNGTYVVLCSGGGLVQVALDDSGQPTGAGHLCPDLVLGLLVALDLPPAGAIPSLTPSRPVHVDVVILAPGVIAPSPGARDPPVSV